MGKCLSDLHRYDYVFDTTSDRGPACGDRKISRWTEMGFFYFYFDLDIIIILAIYDVCLCGNHRYGVIQLDLECTVYGTMP